jgi:hypothetical protein
VNHSPCQTNGATTQALKEKQKEGEAEGKGKGKLPDASIQAALLESSRPSLS